MGGRNNTGRITMRRKGGGAKRLYRVVDFKRTKLDIPAVVERIEYDPNRTAFIALISYEMASRPISWRRSVWRRRQGARKRQGRYQAGQRDAVLGHADRHDRSQHRAQARQGRADRTRRWHLCAIRRSRWRLCADPPELGRAALVRQECMATVGAVSATPTTATRITVKRAACATRASARRCVVS